MMARPFALLALVLLALPVASAQRQGFEGCPGPGGPDVVAPVVDVVGAKQSPFEGGGATLVAGFANDITLVVTNPLRATFVGTARIQPNGATAFNATSFDVSLAPNASARFALRVTPPLGAERLDAGTIVTGDAGGAAVCAQGGLNAQLMPPVSFEMVSPAPEKGLATVEQLQLSDCGGPGQGGPPTLVSFDKDTRVRVRATNLANGSTAAFDLRARVNDAETVVPVPALAAGESRVLDVGALAPRRGEEHCGVSGYVQLSWAKDASNPRGAQGTAWSFSAKGGVATLGDAQQLQAQAPPGLAPLVYAPPTGTLGQPYVALLNVTNDGASADVNDPVLVSFVPPFRARYAVQGEEDTALTLTTQPGQTVSKSVGFTPLVSGRWEIAVHSGSKFDRRTQLFTLDVPSDINVSIPTASVARVALGETARTPILVRADVPVRDATLRITTGIASSGSREGNGPIAVADTLVAGGLAEDLVRADPSSVALGDLAAGSATWSNASVVSRGSGTYNVVPYVLANGYAYTGRPLAASSSAAAPEYAPAYTVTFEARPVSGPLAFAPAILVLVLGAGAFFGRRAWVK